MKSDVTSLVIAAALHLVGGAAHQHAHSVAGVENSPLEVVFIVIVVTLAPWAAIWLAWRRNLMVGAVLFSVSMLASLVFGLVLHFALESPDLYSNVGPEHGTVFLHSAMGLALLEFVGFVLGAHVAIRRLQRSPH